MVLNGFLMVFGELQMVLKWCFDCFRGFWNGLEWVLMVVIVLLNQTSTTVGMALAGCSLGYVYSRFFFGPTAIWRTCSIPFGNDIAHCYTPFAEDCLNLSKGTFKLINSSQLPNENHLFQPKSSHLPVFFLLFSPFFP